LRILTLLLLGAGALATAAEPPLEDDAALFELLGAMDEKSFEADLEAAAEYFDMVMNIPVGGTGTDGVVEGLDDSVQVSN